MISNLQYDFIPLFHRCGQAVSDALRGCTGIGLNEPVGNIGAGGDQTLRIDQVAEQAALRCIRESDIHLNIMSEEIGLLDHGAEVTLIIDPIDQTLNARRNFPYFSFSIAAYCDGDVISGYIQNLASGNIFHAARGLGAFQNGNPVRVSNCTKLNDAHCFVIRSAKGYDRLIYHRFFFETRLLRVTGCSSLDLCHVASGHWDAFVHAELRKGHGEKNVDVVAAKLIVEEAGGVVRDVYGNNFEIILDVQQKRSILATSTPALMDEILAVLHE